VRTWFKGLPPSSIDSWAALEYDFLRKWGEKKDLLYLLTDIGSLENKHNEFVRYFIKTFNKIYNKILANVEPLQPAAKFTFDGSFDPKFSLLLRVMTSTTLNDIQYDNIQIESNMIALGNVGVTSESREQERRKQK